jgi:hypothetical protein
MNFAAISMLVSVILAAQEEVSKKITTNVKLTRSKTNKAPKQPKRKESKIKKQPINVKKEKKKAPSFKQKEDEEKIENPKEKMQPKISKETIKKHKVAKDSRAEKTKKPKSKGEKIKPKDSKSNKSKSTQKTKVVQKNASGEKVNSQKFAPKNESKQMVSENKSLQTFEDKNEHSQTREEKPLGDDPQASHTAAVLEQNKLQDLQVEPGHDSSTLQEIDQNIKIDNNEKNTDSSKDILLADDPKATPPENFSKETDAQSTQSQKNADRLNFFSKAHNEEDYFGVYDFDFF